MFSSVGGTSGLSGTAVPLYDVVNVPSTTGIKADCGSTQLSQATAQLQTKPSQTVAQNAAITPTAFVASQGAVEQTLLGSNTLQKQEVQFASLQMQQAAGKVHCLSSMSKQQMDFQQQQQQQQQQILPPVSLKQQQTIHPVSMVSLQQKQAMSTVSLQKKTTVPPVSWQQKQSASSVYLQQKQTMPSGNLQQPHLVPSVDVQQTTSSANQSLQSSVSLNQLMPSVSSQQSQANKVFSSPCSSQSAAEDKLNLFLEKEKQMKELLFAGKLNVAISSSGGNGNSVPLTYTTNMMPMNLAGHETCPIDQSVPYLMATEMPLTILSSQPTVTSTVLTRTLNTLPSGMAALVNPGAMQQFGSSQSQSAGVAAPSGLATAGSCTAAASATASRMSTVMTINTPTTNQVNPLELSTIGYRANTPVTTSVKQKRQPVDQTNTSELQRQTIIPKKSKLSHDNPEDSNFSALCEQASDENEEDFEGGESIHVTPSLAGSHPLPSFNQRNSNSNLLQDVLNEKILELLQSSDVQHCLRQQQQLVRKARLREASRLLTTEYQSTPCTPHIPASTTSASTKSTQSDSESSMPDQPVASRTTSIWSREASAFTSVMRSHSTES